MTKFLPIVSEQIDLMINMHSRQAKATPFGQVGQQIGETDRIYPTAERYFASTFDNHSTTGATSGNIDPNNPGLVRAYIGVSGTTIEMHDSDGMQGYAVGR